MHIARMLLLTALAALAALALTATNASAIHVEQEVDENTMANCDPCLIHGVATQEAVLVHKIAGPISQCQAELDGEVYEDGTGHLELMSATGANCNVMPCAGAEAEWPAAITENAGALQASARLCISVFGGPGFHCDLTADIVDEGTHLWILDSPGYECQNPGAGAIVIVGQWELEEQGESVNGELTH